MSRQLGDLISLTTYDGERRYIPSGGLRILAYGNFGAPPVEWITSRGYRQHGATVLDFFTQPRTVTLELYQTGACGRQQYWDSRAELINLLRPNRGGPLKLTVRTSNGNQRALYVRPDPGLTLPPVEPTVNNWAVQEAIDLIAHDPIWFDPESVDLVTEGTIGDDLIFPITFPIAFGLSGLRFIFNQVYRGTWESFPIFEIDGPYDSALFINEATGARFQLMLPISSGERRIVDLTPGRQSVTDSMGINRFGELAPNSNLVQFSLQPDPIVPGGAQQIHVILSGATADTRVTIHYFERYFGI